MKKIFILFAALMISSSMQISSNIDAIKHNKTAIVKPTEEQPKENDFELSIEHIKKYESFSSTIYIDTDGSPTIGYGHHILKGEKFTEITEDKADEILKRDFNKRVKLVENKYKLKSNKALAIAMFIYNIGSTKFAKSTLKKLVMADKPIDKEIIKWDKFKYKGKYKTNAKLKERREFELKMYNKEL